MAATTLDPVSSLELVLAFASGLLLFGLLLGLVVRRRHRYALAFTTYVAAQLGVNVLGLSRPEILGDWLVWTVKESTYALLRLLLAAEVVALVFRALPRARARAQLLQSLLGAVLVIALLSPYDTRNGYLLAKDVTSRLSYATVWSLITILGLVAWYRVPLQRFHKALLHGMLWLLVGHFGAVYVTGRWGSATVGLVYHVLQLGVLLLWFWVAWSCDPTPTGDEAEVLRRLQPWRVP